MKVRCKTCGKMTNQPITEISRKIRGKRPYMPICKECYDKYREQWDASDIDQITKSTRKTVTGRAKGDIAMVTMPNGRKKSPIYVRWDKVSKVWRSQYTNEKGQKRIIPKTRFNTPGEAVRAALEYCRKHRTIDEDLARKYCEERDLPYYPPQEKEVA